MPWTRRHLAALLLTGLALSAWPAGAGEDVDVPPLRDLLPPAQDGWKLEDSLRTYDPESIFDYINGAGEVYRAYDFREVSVYRYSRSDH
ncbi:MAG: hypothetical protein GF355_16345, partial [Candidatus Eisenbacteria bacterium]|nr:hypothetical protein [Candidatus Eisenbacteria bacterium]